MERHLQFKVTKKDKKIACDFLVDFTDHPLYEIDEKYHVLIGGFFKNLPEDLPNFLPSFKELPNQINWQEQWEEFSPHIHNNRLELDLHLFGVSKRLILTPGPGFGDMSHPTTTLCLKHMAKLCQGRDVIDFGCGSGILSVAAYAFGAKRVFSLEIDPESIHHAKSNLDLNGFSSDFVLSSMPKTALDDPLCIINMTFGEQKMALWDMSIFPSPTQFLSSGLLNEQKNAYLNWAKSKNLNLESLDKEGKWLIFKGMF
jgi:ribosomal protein L11 methyltransferase